MSASFEEKSVWIQLLSLVAMLVYFTFVAGSMLVAGVNDVAAFASLFLVAVLLLVVLLLVGLAAAALVTRPEDADERDRIIAWRAESNSSRILATGVSAAIVGFALSISAAWVAYILIVTLLLSEIARCAFQLVYYRRGL